MSKKLLAIIALVVASLFVFTACSSDKYPFEALTPTPSADAACVSNGGMYVQKGDYSYFINGAEDGTDTNTFGTYHKGSIVRYKTSELLNPNRGEAETVVPKIIYAEEANSSGFYIFEDKIYYTTPNSGKDAQGNVQYTKMDFMMANLDGTGTKLIATIEDNTQAFRFVKSGTKVYLLYIGTADITLNDEKTSTTAIYEIDCASKEEKIVADNVETFVFDKYADSSSVAYSQKIVTSDSWNKKEVVETNSNNLFKYTAGAQEAVKIESGLNVEDRISAKYTPVSLTAEVVYYNTESKGLVYGKTFNKYENGKSVKLADSSYDSMIVSANSKDVIFVQEDGYIVKVTFAAGKVADKQKVCAEAGDIKFEYVTESSLYYSMVEEYVLKVADLSKDELVVARKAISGQMKSTLWASYDFVETTNGQVNVFYFNDADEITHINYAYMCWLDTADGLNTHRIGYLSPNERNIVFDNQIDDDYAVEDFTKKA